MAVRKNLEVLRDGVGLLNAYASELTEDAIDAVNRAQRVIKIQLAQLYEVGAVTAELEDAEAAVAEQLSSRRPWLDIGGVEAQVDAIRAAHAEERRRRLAEQQTQAEEVREQIKSMPGVSELDADARHALLRPVTKALDENGPEAVAPSLKALLDGFPARLRGVVEHAQEEVDALRDAQSGEVVVKVTMEIRNREIRSVADVDALLDEIRTRLMEQLDKGQKVRLRLR